ncbi:hypothetical protein PQO01_11825 [Lentisphaera marina]|uniref:hypothetical protein n=1 Tax=Lentisphaera marina TaxID=1111041 RepID=UPI002366DF77|nr:hypothetical protein [Lentisphaera marina]MDD7985638.1 hypothetical protein [Lentisphaera marina]
MKFLFICLFVLANTICALELGVAHNKKIILPSKDWNLKFLADEGDLDLRLLSIEEHGGNFEYDFEVIANAPGSYNLLDFLRPPQKTTIKNFDPVLMEFETVLAEGFNGELRGYKQNEIELSSWYQLTTKLLIGIWFLGLILIIFIKKKKPIIVNEQQIELTLAQYLLSRLEKLNQGQSNKELWQEVELSCIQFCREQLKLQDLSGAEVFEHLKADAEIANLILSLEKALHANEKINMQSLLNQIHHFAEVRA